MFDKDASLALLPQLTSRWKIIANVSYDNHSLFVDMKDSGLVACTNHKLKYLSGEPLESEAQCSDCGHVLPYLLQSRKSILSFVQDSIPEENKDGILQAR